MSQFDRAKAEAAKSNKILLIDFFTTWCAPCKRLEKETWNDPAVRAWMSEYCIDLRVDAEAEPALAQRYLVNAYPTILLLRADGTEMDRLVGFRDAATFLQEVTSSLNGKTSLSRAKDQLAGHEDDPMERGRYGDELARAGKYEEALKEYLWCFDEGGRSLGYGGVRLSFLLSDIVNLGKRYPPAIRALEDRRDEAERRLLATAVPKDCRDQKLLQRSTADIHDVSALNRVLKTPDRTMALYDRMRKQGELHAMQRMVFSMVLVDPLVDQRRYQDVLSLFDEPEGYVTGQIELDKTLRNRRGLSDEEKADFDSRHALETRTIESAAHIFEALVGTRQDARAGKVADQILDFAPGWRTYVALIEAASRAGSAQTARQIGDRGLRVLDAEGVAVVRDALGRLPK